MHVRRSAATASLNRVASLIADPEPKRLCPQVVHNMTCAFQASFSRWTVGFGIEGQWNALRAAVGLERLPGLQEKAHNLDYALLVKPHEVEATLTGAAAMWLLLRLSLMSDQHRVAPSSTLSLRGQAHDDPAVCTSNTGNQSRVSGRA